MSLSCLALFEIGKPKAQKRLLLLSFLFCPAPCLLFIRLPMARPDGDWHEMHLAGAVPRRLPSLKVQGP